MFSESCNFNRFLTTSLKPLIFAICGANDEIHYVCICLFTETRKEKKDILFLVTSRSTLSWNIRCFDMAFQDSENFLLANKTTYIQFWIFDDFDF